MEGEQIHPIFYASATNVCTLFTKKFCKSEIALSLLVDLAMVGVSLTPTRIETKL